MKKIAVLLLAGGKSERMKFPKPYLEINGESFVQILVSSYRKAGIKKIVLVLNHDYTKPEWNIFFRKIPDDVELVLNYHPDLGRIHSIKNGLEKIEPDCYCFIQNIDMPCILPQTIKLLCEMAEPGYYIVPQYNYKNGHPVLLSPEIISELVPMLNAEVKLNELLKKFKRKLCPTPDAAVVSNINSMDDYISFIPANNA